MTLSLDDSINNYEKGISQGRSFRDLLDRGILTHVVQLG